MKENRIGVVVCGVVSIITLVLSIVFSIMELKWWGNVMFSIMGSAWVSLVFCLINYWIIRKKLIEELANDLYIFNNDTNTQIYSTNGNKSSENLAKVIGTASGHLVTLAYKAYTIKMGFFKCEKIRRILINEIISEIENNLHRTVFSIGNKLQSNPEEVNKNVDNYYTTISNLLKYEFAYDKAIILAKSVKSAVKKAQWKLD